MDLRPSNGTSAKEEEETGEAVQGRQSQDRSRSAEEMGCTAGKDRLILRRLQQGYIICLLILISCIVRSISS
jgi:hypothetical protein